MGQSLVKNLVHVIYSTKQREPWIADDIGLELWAYQAGIFKAWESPALEIGGVEDHVHALGSFDQLLLQRNSPRVSAAHIPKVLATFATAQIGHLLFERSLFSLSKNHALKKVIEEVKKASSKWMKTDGAKNADFYWQGGYAAFSVSQSNVEQVKRYIKNQKEHHRKMTFQDELREFFKRHEVEYDERYVWD